MKEPLSLE
jgi:hypothetical protein